MKPTIQVVRAIAAEFAWRKVKPILFIITGVLVAMHIAGVWLVTINTWWWFLLGPIIFVAIVFAVVSVLIFFVLKIIAAEQTKLQKREVKAYVDQLERVSENVQTPYPVLLTRVILDVFRPSTDGIIATVSHDSKTLAPGFISLLKSFQDPRIEA